MYRKQLSEIINETAGISPEMAIRLEQGFGIDAQFWLDLQSKYDLWKKLPRIPRITA